MQVLYLEWRGELQPVAGRLVQELAAQPGFIRAELQTSPQQPGLYLLVSWWNAAPPAVQLPAGAKAWAFEVVI